MSFDQQARTAQADLPGILERRAHQRVQLVAPVAVGEDQGGFLPPSSSETFFSVGCGERGDALADRGAAGERHGAHPGWVTSGSPASAPSPWTILSTPGEAYLRRQFAQHRGGERGHFGGLGDHAVAGGQGRGDLPGEQVQRQVPRRDRGDHAQRRAQGVVEPGFAVCDSLANWVAAWAKKRRLETARGISISRARAKGLPPSSDSARAKASMRDSSAAASFSSQAARSLLRNADQPGKALSAAATAVPHPASPAATCA